MVMQTISEGRQLRKFYFFKEVLYSFLHLCVFVKIGGWWF
jgi:hypothetical protein